MRVGRLTLKMYVYSILAVHAAIFVLVASIMSFRSAQLPERTFLSQHLAADLWHRRDDPDGLQAQVARGMAFSVPVTVYDTEGRLIASTATPPLPMLSQAQVRRLEAVGHVDESAGFFAHPIREGGRFVGVGIANLNPPFLARHAPRMAIPFILVLAASLAFARHIARPLQQLANLAKRFGRGEMTARARFSRKDEIGDLGRAFDDMADRVTGLMAAQQELLVNVSHELLTPLSRIQVAVDLLRDGEAKQAKDLVSEIAQDLAEIERLLDDVMTVARLDLSRVPDGATVMPLRRESTSIDELIQAAVSRFRAQCQTHQIVAEVSPVLPAASADRVLLRRVVENLLDNARKYSDAGTTIRIRASGTKNGVRVAVADDGTGIDAADLKKVFTPFFRSDKSRSRSTGGVGLGLALARRVVEAHGGTIEIASTPGAGTTVTLVLPAQAANA